MSGLPYGMELPAWFPLWLTHPVAKGAVAILVTTIGAFVAELLVRRVMLRLAARTETDVDDKVIELLRRPIFVTVIFAGLAWATLLMEVTGAPKKVVFGVLQSLAAIMWATAGFRIGSVLLKALSARPKRGIVSKPTLPAFLILARVAFIALGMYFVFLAWDIDLTAWMASAGIIGIAVGFGAKDTLANLFAGVFIVADAPYKVGDWIVIDNDLRGRVVNIGMRSTRLQTRDDVEITIPNSIIGSSKVVNEDGGPIVAHRVRIYVSVAYGSDVDRVFEVMLQCAEGVPNVCTEPKPETRFRSLGESGLNMELMVWCDEPSRRGKLISNLTTNVYKAFKREGIEIPFNQLDLHIKSSGAAKQLASGKVELANAENTPHSGQRYKQKA